MSFPEGEKYTSLRLCNKCINTSLKVTNCGTHLFLQFSFDFHLGQTAKSYAET